jgi:tripartite-type tricarboxylate transporter receptor subunit TctC
MYTKQPLYFAGLVICGTLLGCCAWSVGVAATQPYPNRLVKVITDSPGGPIDIIARAMGDKLAGSLKQPFVIENRAGAGGNLGAEAIARSVPDGYTLGMVLGTTLTVNASLFKKLPFNPDRDFRPIAITTTS